MAVSGDALRGRAAVGDTGPVTNPTPAPAFPRFPWAKPVLSLSCLVGAAAICGCGSFRRATDYPPSHGRPYHAMVLRNHADLKWLYSPPEPVPGRELASGTLGAFSYADHESSVAYRLNERTYVLTFDVLHVKPVGSGSMRVEEVHCRVIDADLV